MENKIIEIPVDKIRPNPNQSRKSFDEGKLKELAESIKASGLAVPIQVTKKNDYWEIISGERRWRAHKIARLKTIQAIEKKYVKDSSRRIDSLMENLHRVDLNEVEKAKTLKEIQKEDDLSLTLLAQRVGLSDTYVRHLLNLLNPDMKHLTEAVKKGEIIEHHARIIKGIQDEPTEKKVLDIVKEKGLSVTKTEELVNVLKKVPKEVKTAILNEVISVEQAENISKLNDKEKRDKAIGEFKSLKVVEKNIVKNAKNRDSAKEKRELQKKLEKAETWIKGLKMENIATLRQLEKTIKVLLMAVSFIPVIDEKQKEKLLGELTLFIEKCERGSQLAEEIKEKIENYDE